MGKDIRLYWYQDSQFHKNVGNFISNKAHKFKSIEDCEEYIEQYERLSEFSSRREFFQFVIVEFTSPYCSKILKVIDHKF